MGCPGRLLGLLWTQPGHNPGHFALGVPVGAGDGLDGARSLCQPQPSVLL